MSHQDNFIASRLPDAKNRARLQFDLPKLRFGDHQNAVTTLFDRAQHNTWMSNPFLRCPGLVLTYADCKIRVDKLATQLVNDLGLVSGNRVLLRGSNSIGMAIAWMAVVRAGLIAVATMPLLRAKELGEIIFKGNITYALCDERVISDLQTIDDIHIITFSADGNYHLTSAGENNTEQSDAVKTDAIDSDAVETDLIQSDTIETDDIAMMAFTSGTTGTPKAACHSHRDLLAACECWPAYVLSPQADDIVIGSPPLAFTFGLGGLLLFPMWAGASIYFPDKPYTPENMIDTINAQGITICYTAPTFYRMMAPFAKAKGVGKLRVCVSAGEALADTTRQLWKQTTGINMLDGIGATEMFHIFISSAGSEIRDGSIGKVVPGYTAKVVDENGHQLPNGQVGKLAVIGPTSCKYFDDERQTNYVKDGWNYPGDAFIQDDDGYFFYQSRADDMIITSGYNVGGPEVENCLLAHSAVAECGIIGKPDADRGMIVKAFIVLKPNHLGDAAMTKQLQDWVKQQLAPYKYPREIEYLTSMPRTETGKLQRFKLRQL